MGEVAQDVVDVAGDAAAGDDLLQLAVGAVAVERTAKAGEAVLVVEATATVLLESLLLAA